MNVFKSRLAFFGLSILAATFIASLAWSDSQAAGSKPTRFWNLTGETIVKFELAPAGKDDFGPDQCENDQDHAVDDDERLPIKGIAPGPYDARITFKNGRVCLAKDIAVGEGKVFSIDGKQLTDCHEPK